MSSLKQITIDVMNDIKFGLQIASGACTGNPISEPDINRLQADINKFPDASWKAQEAWDMHVEDAQLKDLVSRLSEASDRLSAVYTMMCDIVPALDARQYDFYTVNAVLPYLTFTVDTLEEMVKEFEADLTILRNTIEPVDLSENKLFKRVVRFIDESLKVYCNAHPSDIVSGFRVYALQSMRKFAQGEEPNLFEFALGDISCSFNGYDIEIYKAEWVDSESVTNWSLTINMHGDVYGEIQSEDLDLEADIKEGIKLSIDAPEEYLYDSENEG